MLADAPPVNITVVSFSTVPVYPHQEGWSPVSNAYIIGFTAKFHALASSVEFMFAGVISSNGLPVSQLKGSAIMRKGKPDWTGNRKLGRPSQVQKPSLSRP